MAAAAGDADTPAEYMGGLGGREGGGVGGLGGGVGGLGGSGGLGGGGMGEGDGTGTTEPPTVAEEPPETEIRFEAAMEEVAMEATAVALLTTASTAVFSSELVVATWKDTSTPLPADRWRPAADWGVPKRDDTVRLTADGRTPAAAAMVASTCPKASAATKSLTLTPVTLKLPGTMLAV